MNAAAVWKCLHSQEKMGKCVYKWANNNPRWATLQFSKRNCHWVGWADAIILENGCIASEALDVSIRSAYMTVTIVTEFPKHYKLFTWWMPIEKHSMIRVQTSTAFLEWYNNKGKYFLACIVTGSETWVHHYEHENKRQSLEWQHISFPERTSSLNLLVERSCSPSSGIWIKQLWNTIRKRMNLWIVPNKAQCWRRSCSQQYGIVAEDIFLKEFSLVITHAWATEEHFEGWRLGNDEANEVVHSWISVQPKIYFSDEYRSWCNGVTSVWKCVFNLLLLFERPSRID